MRPLRLADPPANSRAVLCRLSLLGVLAAFALAACSEDTDPEPAVSGTTLPATVETPTTTAPTTTTSTTPTTTSTTTTVPVAEVLVSIEDDTVWRDVLDSLPEAEQQCILEALGDELEDVMDLAVLSDADGEWQAPLLACLDPDATRELYLAIIVAGVEADFMAGVGPQEEACLRERLSDEDLPALAADPESPDAARFFGEMMGCIPDVLFSMFMEEMVGATGAAGLELSEEQVSCVQDAMADIDWAVFIDNPEPEDPEAAADFLDAVVSCVPDVFVSLVISEMEAEIGELSDEARSCLREAVTDLDWSAILGDAPEELLADLLPALIGCAPELLFLDDEAVPSDGDDHGDFIDEATPVALGDATGAAGVLDYEGDIDLFVFEAVAGEFYQIDVALGTLDDSTVALYDADGFELAYNDDYGGTSASRLYWEATDSGLLYVGVEGWNDYIGTYTLTVVVLDFVDDHGDFIDEATPVALGDATGAAGVLDYEGDIDLFVFEAVAGEFYQIDVALGTLTYSTVALYDAEGVELAYNDDYRVTPTSRLYWEAADSGPVYVWVGGWDSGAGPYTLTVVVLDFVDDHGDRNAEATPVALGEAIAGVLDYGEDVDVFRFEAVAGELYQIGVWPGTVIEPFVTLRDADGLELAYDDGHAETPAVRLYWEATNSGPHYVAVGSPGAGPYTLIITER